MSTRQYVRHDVQLQRLNQQQRNTISEIRGVLICDCETTLDFEQRLRLAGYCLYSFEEEKVIARGLVTGDLDKQELRTLQTYAKKNNIAVKTRQDFIQNILYPLLANGVVLANHNIPFDLGCLATAWLAVNSTFYLKLCDCIPTGDNKFVCDKHPCISVRSLNFPKALMYVEGDDVAYSPIVDTMTIGRALLGPGDLSLKGMGQRFKCQVIKQISDEHGEKLNESYLTYTMQDVAATLELFLAEIREYKRHGLSNPIHTILSEASIGKAYLQKLAIPPFYEQHKELPEWLTPTSMKTMYGARSEVKCRLKPTLVRYCDFKSQYPTVNALLGLQDLLLSRYLVIKHKTQEVQAFLNKVDVQDLQKPGIWKHLRALVKFAPDNDIVPNKFDSYEEGQRVEGYAVCYTKGDNNTPAPSTWYTLCDAVASKLLTGKAPKLVDAIVLYPSGRVPTNTLNLFDRDNYSIDLSKEDFFVRVIDLRTTVKKDLKQSAKAGDMENAEYLTSLQLALKLLANSTAYGVLVETRYENGVETAGKYYAAPIGVNITAGARLLLAIAERLGRDNGLSYAMCDTDSMAYALPEGMDVKDFYRRVDTIVNWFNPLSPYEGQAALFELEEVNEWNGQDTPLYFFGVSCKRYVLYNKLENGQYRIRKLSAHATGRYSFDRDLPIPEDIPEVPYITIDGKKKKLFKDWMYLLWYRAIEQAERGITDIEIPNEEWSNQAVRYQEAMSTPGKLKSHSYLPGIRPYSFLLETPSTPGKNRYVMPFVSSNEDVLKAKPFIAGTLKVDHNPQYDTLRNRFSSFFSHEEVKASPSNGIGMLERRTLEVGELHERTRTGRKILSKQPAIEEASNQECKQTSIWDVL